MSILVKGISISISFLFVRFCLEYLNGFEYGLWLTISSVLSWFNLFNIGLGHGLRNRLAEAMAINDTQQAKIYVSTTYAILGLISLGLIIVFTVIGPFINWDVVFNIRKTLPVSIFYTVALVFITVCLRLFIGLITIVLTALHRIALAEFIMLLSDLIVLIGLYILKENTRSSMLYVAILYTLVPIVILLIANIFFFKVSYKTICPSYSDVDFSKSSNLFSLGFKFFVIQIAAVILFSTDNIIITHLFSAEDVTRYNMSLKYFSVLIIGFSTITAPFWSGITDAYKKGDYSWMQKSSMMLFKLWMLLIPVVIFMVILSDFVYQFWLGRDIVIPLRLNITMGIYVLSAAFNTIVSSFINGLGKLKIQYFLGFFSIILNIPLSIFFAKNMELGVIGVAIGTIFCQILAGFILTIQFYKIINIKAKGLWLQ